jgi:APA family basic amino acid/polyamine antiporter
VVLPRGAKLPRTLGAPALFSACYGNVGASIYYALGVTAAFALGLTPLALILAGCVFVTTALSYAEGTAALPHAGGSSSFARRAFNVPIGFIVGWVQLLNYTVTVTISAFTAVSYFAVLAEYVPLLAPLHQPLWRIVAAIGLVGLLIVVNIIGIQESSFINLLLALLDLGTQLVLVVLGVLLLLNFGTLIRSIHFGVAPTWGNFLASVSLAMVTYTGIETISNMSEEARNPARTIPRSYLLVIVAVLFVSAFLPSVGLSVFPAHFDPASGQFVTDLAQHWRNDPVSGIVSKFQPAWLAYWAGVWVAILAFTILVISTNAGLIGISRLSYSLATYKLFPRPFAALHPRFKTPYISIIVFGIAAALLILPNQIDQMAATYSLAATSAFCVAHLAVMRLRYVVPDLRRPFRMPLNVRFGRSSISVLSLAGALAVGAVFTQLIAENIAGSSFIYLGWLALGALAFVAYRKYHHRPIWEPLEAAPPEPRSGGGPHFERVPAAERVHVGRRKAVHESGQPKQPGEGGPAPLTRRRQVARVLVACVFAVVAAACLAVDLSPLDPFGPGPSWSPGVVVVLAIATFLLFRSRVGR